MKTRNQKAAKRADGLPFGKFMDELNKTIDFEMGSLFVFERESSTLKQVATKGEGIDFINRVRFPLGVGLSAWVAQKGKMVYLPDIHRGSRHGLNPIRSYLSVPLELNNRTVAVLNLGHVIPNAFDKKTFSRIETICKSLTRKIYNRTYLNYVSNQEVV